MDMSDPELDSELEFDPNTQTVTGTVRIERTCSECGTPLKEGQLEMEGQFDGEDAVKLEAHLEIHRKYTEINGGAELGVFEVNEDSVNPIEEGGGRYKKSYYGAVVYFTVTCSCDNAFAVSGSMEDKMPASSMDEMAQASPNVLLCQLSSCRIRDRWLCDLYGRRPAARSLCRNHNWAGHLDYTLGRRESGSYLQTIWTTNNQFLR
jgi:hypothetical protein